MAQIVRQSKFRHVFCKPVKHENCMSDLKVTEITWDSLFCAVNPKFIALINRGAGGPFMVIPVNKIGRIDKDYPFVDAHKAPCLEVAWSPFNDNVIASCSEDTTAKVWLIPEGGLRKNITEPVVELCGHQKRVNTLAWHPTAANVLLTAGGENKILIWNVGTGEVILEIDGHPDMIWSVAFNYDGSRFVTTCKDKRIRILDSHTGEVLQQGMGPEGVKPQRAIFDRYGRIVSTGFTKRSERLYSLRNPDDLDNPVMQEELDTSNGVLFPLYDEDTGLLYLVGKGDCAIRYYEVNDDPPFMHYINTYTTSEPQRAIGYMCKRGVSSMENEVNRIYKLTTKGVVDILQFFVPRKSDLWQADLYPDTRSLVPALSAEQFADGGNAPPNLMPVNPEAAAAASKPKIQAVKKANILSQLAPQAESAPAPTSYKEQAPAAQSSPRPSQQQQPSPRPAAQQQQASPRRPVNVDDDMGIVVNPQRPPSASSSSSSSRPAVREPSPERANPMLVRNQVNLRSRGDRDGADGPMSAGQKRAAAELERIRRDQSRIVTDEDRDSLAPSSSGPTPSMSPRMSVSSSMEGGPTSMEELVGDLQRMKAVLRQHERRIRMLEEHLADANMQNTYGF
ncbi:hypothetical protein PFISCL1PPCAC_12307 [Pristionchus fissidentatus]|uniref:Coronin n=1 Tax=Pristionchus fissidentatus TaxID=1538716 RepID=A0AAV5VQR9_9BILA|nr:hypothetical protein PFISCL1PPCAC_12307 [Pristionchus fissidentatus]